MTRPLGPCSACLYFDGTLGKDASEGVCRRHAPAPEPRLLIATASDETAWWPAVGVDEWCGDFMERPVPQAGMPAGYFDKLGEALEWPLPSRPQFEDGGNITNVVPGEEMGQ